MNRKCQSGFTLVELVMVIVLIGVLSVAATSLFYTRDGYSSFVAQGQVVSSALLAQQVALGMSATNNPVSLTLAVDGAGDWVFTVSKAGQSPIVVNQDSAGASLLVDGVTLSAGASYTFTWDSGANLTTGSNHEIRFAGSNTHRVCLSSSGYAYASSGACP